MSAKWCDSNDLDRIAIIERSIANFLQRLYDPQFSATHLANFVLQEFESIFLRAAATAIRDFHCFDMLPHDLLSEYWFSLVRHFESEKARDYVHVNRHCFQAWLWRIAIRAAYKFLASEQRYRSRMRSINAEMIAAQHLPAICDLREEEIVTLEQKLRCFIDKHFTGRRRAVLLVQLATRDVTVTANKCKLVPETVQRYIRGATRVLQRFRE